MRNSTTLRKRILAFILPILLLVAGAGSLNAQVGYSVSYLGKATNVNNESVFTWRLDQKYATANGLSHFDIQRTCWSVSSVSSIEYSTTSETSGYMPLSSDTTDGSIKGLAGAENFKYIHSTPTSEASTFYYVRLTLKGNFAEGSGTFMAKGGQTPYFLTTTVPVATANTIAVSVNSSTACLGSSATVTATPTFGSAGDYNYVWSGPGTNPGNVSSFTTTAAGNYTVVISNKLTPEGCLSASASGTVGFIAPPAVPTVAVIQPACNGSTGTINVTATAANGITYSIDGANYQSGTTFSGLTAGTYTVSAKNACGTPSSTTITIVEPTKVVASVSANRILCNGGTTTVTVSAVGGTGEYTGVGEFTVGAGTYNYTVTDANGCPSTVSITVAEPTKVVASVSANRITCNGGTTTVTVSAVGGTGEYTGVGEFTVGAGTYNYTVTDANGCSSTVSITVAEPTKVVASVSANRILCNGGTTTVTVSAVGGTGEYTGVGEFTVGAGTYNYTVTDANSCSSTVSITVAEPTKVVASVSANRILCNGGTTTVTVSAVGGTGEYTGVGEFTVGAGTYNYTVTDANGCPSTVSITVAEPTKVVASVSANRILCNGGTTTVTVSAVGGTGEYTGTGEFAVGAGTYNYTVTDANDCPSTVSITVAEPTKVVASVSANRILCNGGTTTVTVSAVGGTGEYTGVGEFTVGAGTYNYTVTDANGCPSTVSITVDEPTKVVASSTAGRILCNGGTTIVTVSAAGGTGNYTGAGTFEVRAGTYNYTVTDANGCSATTSITVTQPDALTASAAVGTIVCNGGTTSVVVSATGGAAPYAGTGIYSVRAGAYSYTVTDANGCTSTVSGTIADPAKITVSATGASNICVGTPFTLSASSGVSYSWTGPNGFTSTSKNPTVSNAVMGNAGTYTVTVTDANGCSNTATASVTVKVCTGIYPTEVTPTGFNAGTGVQLPYVCLTLKSTTKNGATTSVITNATPGVFFYYTNIIVPAANFSLWVKQTAPAGAPRYLLNQGQAFIFSNGGTTKLATGVDKSGDALVNITNAVPGSVITISVKYDAKSVVTSTAYPASIFANSSALYKFETLLSTSGPATSGSNAIPNTATSISSSNCAGGVAIAAVTSKAVTATEEVVESAVTVSAFPNPFANRITFKVTSPISGNAALELFDMAGRKVAMPFQGTVEAGVTKMIGYDVPSANKVPMVYKFSVGSKTFTGKLMPLQ